MQDAICYFPARPLTPDERALLTEWLGVAGDIAEAYVSDRHDDDPALHRRIVVVTNPSDGPSHLVHAPTGRKYWVVFSIGRRSQVQTYQTLRDALNSIRPVLADTGLESSQDRPE